MKLTQTKIAALTVISSIVLATNVQAQDGFSIGVNTSNGTFSHTIERNTGTPEIPSITTRTEETDFGYGINVGYQLRLSDNFYFAGEAFYQGQDIETRNINNILITELTLNSSYGIKLKSGIYVNEQLSIYGFSGVTTLDFDINNSYTFAPPTTQSSADVDEFTVGVGIEYAISDHWSVTAEYSQLNDVSFDPIPEVAFDSGKINNNEVDYSSISFGINYTF